MGKNDMHGYIGVQINPMDRIHLVAVYGRTGRWSHLLNDFAVFMGPKIGDLSRARQCGSTVYHSEVNTHRLGPFWLPCGGMPSGGYIWVTHWPRHRRHRYLTMSELELFGEPAEHICGYGCSV